MADECFKLAEQVYAKCLFQEKPRLVWFFAIGVQRHVQNYM